MNKIFTLFAASIMAFGMQAQSLELLFGKDVNNLEVVNPETTYETYAEFEKIVDPDDPDWPIYSYTQNSQLYLRGVKGTTVTVAVAATENVQMCGLDGECKIGSNITKTDALGNEKDVKNIVLQEDDIVTIDLVIDKLTQDFEDVKPTSDVTVEVTAYANNDASNALTAKVIMHAQVAGQAAVISDEYIKVAAGNILNYSVVKPCSLQLYAITGNLVARYNLSNAGSLNLSSLSKGIYIYITGTLKGKILVR